jgi:hypothetical protein
MAFAVGALTAFGCARGDATRAYEDPDGGSEAVVDASQAVDGAAADASSDARGASDAPGNPEPRCDPKKPFDKPVVHTELGSTALDSDARLTSDERTVFFRSERSGPTGGSGDIWYATRASATAPFGPPQKVTEVSGTEYDFSPSVTDDLLTLVLVRGAAKIFRATRTSPTVSFGAPSEMPGLYADGIDTQAYLLPNGKRLYFVSTRASLGTRGQPSILVADPSNPAGVPVAFPELDSSTPGFPVVTADERSVYFASPRTDSGAKGERDIWRADRASPTSAFGAPVPVPELNSTADDLPSWISPDGCVAYLSSTRDGTTFAIYEAKRPR